jgi:hypothetical protein
MGHFSEDVARETEVPVKASRATCNPTAVTNAACCAVAGQALDLAMEIHFFFLSFGAGELLFQRSSFDSVLSNQSLALLLTLDHALFSHGFLQ